MPDQCYFTDGEFYECVSDTSAGESPATAPAKWSKLGLPEEWANYLEAEALAYALQADRKPEEAVMQHRAADGALGELALNFYREHGRGRPIQVFTR